MAFALEPNSSVDHLTLPSELSLLAPSQIGGMIRVGRAHDGGYVVPSFSVEDAELLISLGISDDWSFEEHFKKLNPRVRIDAYDHSISMQRFRASLMRGLLKLAAGQTSFKNFAERYRLFVSYNKFFKGEVRHYQERVNSELVDACDITIGKIFERTKSDKVFLKVDIEGNEFKVIDDILKHADKVIGMAIEFHHTGAWRAQFVTAMTALQEQFEVVHLHANNFAPIGADGLPEALEITLQRRSAGELHPKRTHLPIPELDSPNNPRKPDYQIQFSL